MIIRRFESMEVDKITCWTKRDSCEGKSLILYPEYSTFILVLLWHYSQNHFLFSLWPQHSFINFILPLIHTESYPFMGEAVAYIALLMSSITCSGSMGGWGPGINTDYWIYGAYKGLLLCCRRVKWAALVLGARSINIHWHTHIDSAPPTRERRGNRLPKKICCFSYQRATLSKKKKISFLLTSKAFPIVKGESCVDILSDLVYPWELGWFSA